MLDDPGVGAGSGRRGRHKMRKFYKLPCGFLRSQKVIKLQHLLGAEGVLALLRLFEYVAEFAPTGTLEIPIDYVNQIAGWSDEDVPFTSTLFDLKFLRKCGNDMYEVVDWGMGNMQFYAPPLPSGHEGISKPKRKRTPKRDSRIPALDEHIMPTDGDMVLLQDEPIDLSMDDEDGHKDPGTKGKRTRKQKSKFKGVLPKDSESASNAYSEEFERFWAVYPRRIGKFAAYSAWKKTLNGKHGQPADVETLIKSASNYRSQCIAEGKEEQFILHASTFLGPGRRWEDYVITQRISIPSVGVAEPSPLDVIQREKEEMEVLFNGDQRRWWMWVQAGRPDIKQWNS